MGRKRDVMGSQELNFSGSEACLDWASFCVQDAYETSTSFHARVLGRILWSGTAKGSTLQPEIIAK